MCEMVVFILQSKRSGIRQVVQTKEKEMLLKLKENFLAAAQGNA